jgi:RNase H-fold protein (predicted Holliday junction resolvase)
MSQCATRTEGGEGAETVGIKVSGRRTEFQATIQVVQSLIGKKELRDFAVGMPLDLEMNMGRAHVAPSRRIPSRLDRREAVPPIVVGSQQHMPLKVGIKR